MSTFCFSLFVFGYVPQMCEDAKNDMIDGQGSLCKNEEKYKECAICKVPSVGVEGIVFFNGRGEF